MREALLRCVFPATGAPQSATFFWMAMATNKLEFDRELGQRTDKSHLCHWAVCVNVAHSIQEANYVNTSRNNRVCQLKRLRQQAAPGQTDLVQQVHVNCQHGDESIRYFPTGTGRSFFSLQLKYGPGIKRLSGMLLRVLPVFVWNIS